MKRYSMCFGQSIGYKHPHPERTAVKNASSAFDSDLVYQVWPSRKAMAVTIRMQQRREGKSTDWRPLVKLTDGEGY